MNLLELSAAIGIPPDTLKATIAERFQVIVLSDHAQLRGDIVQALGADVVPPEPAKLVAATRLADGRNVALMEHPRPMLSEVGVLHLAIQSIGLVWLTSQGQVRNIIISLVFKFRILFFP